MPYILDAGTIAQRPEILAHAAAGDLLIPQAAVDSIRHRAERGLRRDLQNLLDAAIEAGAIVAPSSDGDTAELAEKCARENGAGNVRVVTTDRRLVRLLTSRGLASISADSLLADLPAASTDADIEQAARRIVSAQRHHLAIGMATATAATAISIAIVYYHQFIFHAAPTWIVPILLFLAGCGFFWWRQRDGLSYGLFEVMVGLLIASQTVFERPENFELSTAKSIQLVGGLYVMVRGFDNIDKGIDDTRVARWWRRLFGVGR